MGLLFMRLVVGSVLLVRASWVLSTGPPLDAPLTVASLAGPGLLLVLGLWTPLAGMAVAAIELSQIFSSGDVFAPLMAATMGGALAMLGPGRWSIDARLFGWKRIEAPRPARTPHAPRPRSIRPPQYPASVDTTAPATSPKRTARVTRKGTSDEPEPAATMTIIECIDAPERRL